MIRNSFAALGVATILLSFFVVVTGCNPTTAEDCDTCIAMGGAWAPSGSGGRCETSCDDVQDAACYPETCPAPCASDSCGTCFSASTCQDAGCAWSEDDADLYGPVCLQP